MRIVVTGGREYENRVHVFHVLDCLDQINPITELTHGAARGVDQFADEWAQQHGVPRVKFPPDWNAFGKAAGPVRNRKMLDHSQPDLVVAFPGGRGTEDCKQVAKHNGFSVLEVGE